MEKGVSGGGGGEGRRIYKDWYLTMDSPSFYSNSTP